MIGWSCARVGDKRCPAIIDGAVTSVRIPTLNPTTTTTTTALTYLPRLPGAALVYSCEELRQGLLILFIVSVAVNANFEPRDRDVLLLTIGQLLKGGSQRFAIELCQPRRDRRR